MRTPAARSLHLGLFLFGVLLYVMFVLPRWWVLTGDIPTSLATVGRIAAGIPIALAGLPVLTILRQSLGRKVKVPEFALRLRAWSAVLHFIAGGLILLAAIAEIWLGLGAAGPYLFAVYGAAAAIAILAALALYLSFVAEKPPAEPKPAKPAKVKKVKAEKKPRGKKRGVSAEAETKAVEEVTVDEVSVDEGSVDEVVVVEETDGTILDAAETVETSTEVTDTDVTVDEAVDGSTDASQPAGLQNKRPAGKRRRLLGR